MTGPGADLLDAIERYVYRNRSHDWNHHGRAVIRVRCPACACGNLDWKPDRLIFKCWGCPESGGWLRFAQLIGFDFAGLDRGCR